MACMLFAEYKKVLLLDNTDFYVRQIFRCAVNHTRYILFIKPSGLSSGSSWLGMQTKVSVFYVTSQMRVTNIASFAFSE